MINSRALLVILVVFIVLVILIGKLFTIQVTEHEKFTRIALNQQNKFVKIKAERGIITDRNEELLAFTKNDVSLFVDTRMTDKKEKERIATKFSQVFNKSKNYYLKLLNSGNKNICIEKKAYKDKVMKLVEFIVDGYFEVEDFSRVYPYGSLASHLLGYVDKDCNGISGIEKFYDEKLTGTDGYKFIENDVKGRVVTVNHDLSVKAVPGYNIQLTINKNYQKILEEEIQNGIQKFKGESAIGILMDPNTGEILALTNQPDYDPANYNLFSAQPRRNRAITDTYEPGSTIKPIIMSILFEEKLATENEVINTENGKYQIRGAVIRDTHKFDKLTVREIIEHSSNIGMAKLSDRIDDDIFFRYLRNYGFGNMTSIDLPGETKGSLKKPKYYSKISKKFISFGYEISVTPIQLITTYCSLINGGNLLQPYLLKNISDFKGKVVQEFNPVLIRKVISNENSELMKDFMIGAVENGTGSEAHLTSVKIGGKTGTTQKLIDKEYSNKEYNSSFVGFFPAENPKLVGLIIVSSPKIGRYGGKVAAPIFNQVVQRIVDTDYDIIPKNSDRNKTETENDRYRLKLDDRPINKDLFITANIPESNQSSMNKTNVYKSSTRNQMPDLLNLTKRDAIKSLNNLGIKYKTTGSGKVISQSIIAGSRIDDGDICLIKCQSNINNIKLRVN